jgi:hypothetical protein
MKHAALVLGILLIGGFGRCEAITPDDSPREVNAVIAVTTKAGATLKLSLVSVYFLTPEQFSAATDTTSAMYLAAIEVLNNQDSLLNYRKNIELADKYEKLRNSYEKYGPESFKKTIPEMEQKRKQYLASARDHKRFSTDPRALHYTLNTYTANGRNHVINEVTNADGRFVVRLQDRKYYVYANDSRKLPGGTEEYHWLFEYTPDASVLLLNNANMIED